MPVTAYLAIAVEIVLLLAGVVAVWRVVLSPSARRNRPAPALGHWPIRPLDFLLFLWLLFMGLMIGAVLSRTVIFNILQIGGADPDEQTRLLTAGLGGQVGMLFACLWLRMLPGSEPPVGGPPPLPSNPATAGFLTFILALPFVGLTAWLWELLLQGFGVPVEPQTLVDLFLNAESPGLRAVLLVFAVIIAPVTEELVFRAGLFRFLRTRVPRLVALIVPALGFALLHVEDWQTLDGIASVGPLVALAVVFSVAYERTGRIAVPIVAHSLFNLNSILLLLSGIPADF